MEELGTDGLEIIASSDVLQILYLVHTCYLPSIPSCLSLPLIGSVNRERLIDAMAGSFFRIRHHHVFAIQIDSITVKDERNRLDI